jgi:hypothetical protein
MLKYKFPPTRILNMDETGISAMQDPGFAVVPKVKKVLTFSQVGSEGEHNSNLHSECKG